MMKGDRVRIFSFQRLLVSGALGVLVLTGYIFGLFLVGRSRHRPPAVMMAIVDWPLWFWIQFGGQFTYEDRIRSLLFVVFCNVVLYATIIYLALLALSTVRRKPTLPNSPPPQPEQFRF